MRRIALFAALLAALSARAELKPEWELGVGLTGLTLPDYRGSDESRGYVLPFPYAVYRGERVRLDRGGLRGVLLDTDRVQFDLSVIGTPPVDSDENRARQGMPHLDPTLELGPRLNVTLARNRVEEWAVTFRLPVRAVVATDLSHWKGAGFTAYPHLALDLRPSFLGGRWNLGFQAGPLFATSGYHEYFYEVRPEHATAERPAYEARGGYSGSLALVSLTRRFRKVWLGAFVRYDMLKGAAFEDSPLVRRDHSVMAGVAVGWVLLESSRQVEVDVDD